MAESQEPAHGLNRIQFTGMDNSMGLQRHFFCVIGLCALAGCSSSTPTADTTSVKSSADIPQAPALDDPIGRLHAALAEKNPDYRREKAAFHPTDGSPIRAAEFDAAGITDLSPLSDLKLTFLALRDNPVSDLRPLARMPLEELYLEGTSVKDLTPLKTLPLRSLYLNNAPVANLLPLNGLPLTQLNLLGTKVTDLSPLAGMGLESLWLNDTKVEDLTSLANCPLVSLTLHRTPVKEISMVRRWPSLQRLHIGETEVTDLRPLEGLRLTRLIVTPQKITDGWDGVRKMSTLNELDIELREPQRWSPDEFWKRFDAGEFK